LDARGVWSFKTDSSNRILYEYEGMVLLDDFRRLGYVVVGPVLSSRELRGLRAAYNRVLAEEGAPTRRRRLTGNEYKGDVVVQVLDMHRRDEAFRRLLYKKALLDLAETFLGGPGVCLYRDQALFKPAWHGGTIRWHQDNHYWNLDPPTAVSCWIALDEATPENGCLWVIPGSHVAGIVAYQMNDGEVEATTDEARAVPIPMPAGHALFHHCQTLHTTRPNRSARNRRAWVIHYMVPGTQQRGGAAVDPVVLRS